MNKLESKRITAAQAAVVLKTASSMLGYLHRLVERLRATGFHASETYEVAERAYHAVHALVAHMHYESCRHGVGTPPKDE